VTPERRRQVEDLRLEALKRPAHERSGFLTESCDGDEDLKLEVESLLSGDSTTEILSSTIPASPCTQTGGRLARGMRLGQYKIVQHLGEGGMGTVYEATDINLGRAVALKLLRPDLLGDSAAAARFQREARTLASLNHPHIAAIYNFEEHEGIRLLVLEYVPGPTLAERLQGGSQQLAEALSVAKQVTNAMEAAHAQGIIHRDLKPANIKICKSGPVKVLDFGLAKTVEHAKRSGPDEEVMTVQQKLTQKMTIIGTPAYMSPEQARGEELDVRTDIWSFGCVLYEQLTAKRAFMGKTLVETLAAIVEREPDWEALPPDSPPQLVSVLKRCLRKDRNRRLRDIADARLELEDISAPEHQAAVRREKNTRRVVLGALAGAVAGAVVTGASMRKGYRGSVRRNLTRFSFPVPNSGGMVPSFNRRIAISPDGSHVAFNSGGGGTATETFYLRSISELEPKQVKDVPRGGAPFFSPDSRWVGFITNFEPTLVRKMALSGGAPVTICPHDGFAGGSWTESDVIYFVASSPGGLSAVPAAGGQPREVAAIDFSKGERQHKYPCALPGGRTVLITVTNADNATFDEAHIAAFSMDSGKRKLLVEGGTHPRYLQSGHLLYARDAKILAVRFDPDRLEVQGQPFTVLEGLQMSRNTGVANFDVSTGGDLAYVPGICDGGARTLVWVDRAGNAEPLPLEAKSYLHPRLSPDDHRVAIEVEGPNHDLYVYDFARGVLANITHDGVSHWPIWSPDGLGLGYRSGPMGHFRMWHVPSDRSAPPRQLTATGVAQSAESWSPDGRSIAYTSSAPGAVPVIMIAQADGGPAQTFAREKTPQGSPKFSPDGRWLAYCSNESGKPEVYVQAFPGPGAKVQISTGGGTDPVWKRQGGELYYRSGDSMIAVTISTAPLNAGRPRELWKGHYSHGMGSSCGGPGATSSNYDVTADGSRFLMVKDQDRDRAVSREVVVVLGWAEEVSRRGSA
jgi:serine/threonine protein kinase